MILIVIVITALANLADIMLKAGADAAGSSLSSPAAIFLTPWIWLGGALGVFAMGMWVYILGRHHISHAYPIFVGLGFINVPLAAHFIFGESISLARAGGIALILAGIIVVHLRSREGSGKEPAAGVPGSGHHATGAGADSGPPGAAPAGGQVKSGAPR